MDIKPSRILYYIPFLILILGSYFFYCSLMDTINAEDAEIEDVGPETYKFLPGENIVIDSLEGELFFIMMEPAIVEDISFYSLGNTTTMQLDTGGSIYKMDFFVYEQNDMNNVIYIDDGVFGFEIDGYEIFSAVLFEEPGAYVIQTIKIDDDFPSLSFAIISERTDPTPSITVDPNIGIFILTIVLTIFTFTPIYIKRKKAILAYDESSYRSYDRTRY